MKTLLTVLSILLAMTLQAKSSDNSPAGTHLNVGVTNGLAHAGDEQNLVYVDTLGPDNQNERKWRYLVEYVLNPYHRQHNMTEKFDLDPNVSFVPLMPPGFTELSVKNFKNISLPPIEIPTGNYAWYIWYDKQNKVVLCIVAQKSYVILYTGKLTSQHESYNQR